MAVFNKEDMTVRRARHSDYNGVMDINREVFTGWDYLYYMYHHFINHAHCYVALHRERIVSFLAYYMLDGDRRAVRIGTRALKQFQGKGITGIAVNHSLADMQKKFPNLRKISFTTDDVDGALKIARKPESGLHIVRRWNAVIYEFKLPATSLMKKLSTVPLESVFPLDKAGINRISDVTMTTLFGAYPYIEALHNWFPLPVTRESLRQIEREGRLAVSRHMQASQDVSKKDISSNIISFSTSILCFNGQILRIHVRNDPNTNMKHITEHVVYHVQHGLSVAAESGRFIFLLEFGDKINNKEMLKHLEAYFGEGKQHIGEGVSGYNLLESKL